MEVYKPQVIETIITLIVFIGLKFLLRYFVKITVLKTYLKKGEKSEILRLFNLLLFLLFTAIILAIWGIRQENILLFASSVFTVFGVALFAEMSILSNITACIILFFQHPVKVGDTIKVNLEGQEIEGELIEITYFFVFIKTVNQETISIPNALLIKSSFSITKHA
jgi:small-conductance mechanosensitive channel